MKYLIVFEDLAQNHIEKLKKSGDISSLKKLNKILNELEIHPRIGLGNPEQLKYQLSGYWSRRINKKDRLIYEIIENPEKQVVIVSALGHY
jgi:toxin YoeB